MLFKRTIEWQRIYASCGERICGRRGIQPLSAATEQTFATSPLGRTTLLRHGYAAKLAARVRGNRYEYPAT